MLKKNVLFGAMFLFVILFYSFLFLASRASVRHQAAEFSPPTEALHGEERLTPERVKEKEERFKNNLLARPRLLLAVTSAVFFALGVGLVIELVWLSRILEKKPLIKALPRLFPKTAWGIGEVFEVLLGLFFIEALLLSVELTLSGWVQWSAGIKDFIVVLNGFIRDAGVAFWVIVLVTRARRQPLSSLGLTGNRFMDHARTGFWAYWGIVPVLAALMALTVFLANFFSYEPPAQAVVEIYLKRSTEHFLVFFTVFVALVGPLIEEIFFRGFAYPAVRARFGPAAGMALTACIFSAMHMSLTAFVPIFFLGVFLAYLYEKTGSLVPSMTAHVLHNAIMVFLTLGFKSLSS